MSLQELAKEALGYFEWASRDTGSTKVGERYEEILVQAPGAPIWFTDLVFAAHSNGEISPCDHRHVLIRNVLLWIADHGQDCGYTREFFESQVDVYTPDLLKWLSLPRRVYYCDAVIQECGAPNMFQLIAAGQYEEAREVFGQVKDFLREL